MPAPHDRPSSQAPTLQLELTEVGKRYAGGSILEDVTLCVQQGDFILISGAPGSGKTTLLGILGLLEAATSGTYRCQGSLVGELDEAERAGLRSGTFGFIFQQPLLLPELNVWQNVARPLVHAGVRRLERRRRALSLLERFGLAAYAAHHPFRLPYAEQQRVAMARAVVNDPAVILADEPTSNLPKAQQETVLASLEALHRAGKTLVVTTQSPALAAYASRHYLLSGGQLHRIPAPTPESYDAAPTLFSDAELNLSVLGRTEVYYQNRPVPLAPRQLDALTLLAAHPEGLTGEQLLLLLYGDRERMGALKATLSKLRKEVPIDNRPYRITTSYRADFLHLEALLKQGELKAAAKLYRGDLLPASDAPGITELRETLAEALRLAVLASGDADIIFALAGHLHDDRELWEAFLGAADEDDPRAALAKAQLGRIERAWNE